MNIPKVPVTATSVPEWVRRAATALNYLLGRDDALTSLEARVKALEDAQ